MGTILFILFLIFLFYYVLRPILRVSFTFRNMKREFEDSMRQQREQYEQAYRNQTSPNGYNGHRQKLFDSTDGEYVDFEETIEPRNPADADNQYSDMPDDRISDVPFEEIIEK